MIHICSRRSVLALFAAASVAMATPVMADEMKLRISTPAVESDWHAKMLTVFKDTLEQSAPGQFNIEIHLNATLFKQGTEPAAMQRGNLDMAMISAQDIAKQIPGLVGFHRRLSDPQPRTSAEGVPRRCRQGILPNGLGPEWAFHILDVGYLGTRQLDLRGDKAIKTPEDMAGIKLRMPGSDAWQFLGTALGANPTPMAFGEVYTGLQTGAIDGQDNPLPTDKAAKFYEVTDQIVLTNHLVDAIFLSIANQTWDKLSTEQQKLVTEAAMAATAYNNENRIADEAQLVQFFKDQGLKVYSPDVDAFRSHVQEMYLNSDFAKDWPEGIVDRVNAVN